MKKEFTKEWMKVVSIGLVFTAFTSGMNAQTADGSTGIVKLTGSALTATTKAGFSVRVVDNRGTVKFLQSNNGITTINNIDAGGNAVTTWQLGGQFTNDTKLDFKGADGTVHSFSFDNVTAVDLTKTDGSQDPASVNSTAVADGKTGWAVLVRDVATGAVKQLLASDLVKGGSTFAKLNSGSLATGWTDATYDAATFLAGGNVVFTESSLPIDVNKISIYRNGSKLIGSAAATTPDYTLSDVTPGSVKIAIKATNGNVADGDDYTLAAGDRIEIQWFR
jgi:hypothetical protein